MSEKTHRLEIAVDGKIVYLQTVGSVELDVKDDGTVALLAQPEGAEPIVLEPPVPTPGAPDGDDETDPNAPKDKVIERVHDGTRDPAAEEAEAKARRKSARATAVAGPTGTVIDGVIKSDAPDPNEAGDGGDNADSTTGDEGA